MRFFKYHGLGNDFIVLAPENPGFRIGAGLDAALAKRLCDRGFGVGADGVMVVAPARDPANHVAMELVNSDGSFPEMCGNGIRCAVRHAVEVLGLDAPELRVETPGGVKTCGWRRDDAGAFQDVRVDMGKARFLREEIPIAGTGDADPVAVEVEGRTFVGTGVNVGNPHFVVFGDTDVEMARRWGPLLENAEAFPAKANIGFAKVEGLQRLRVTVWERGCGLTWACGTGATAAAVVAARRGYVRRDSPISVTLRGGALSIDLSSEDGDAIMIGPATFVFRGEVDVGAP